MGRAFKVQYPGPFMRIERARDYANVDLSSTFSLPYFFLSKSLGMFADRNAMLRPSGDQGTTAHFGRR